MEAIVGSLQISQAAGLFAAQRVIVSHTTMDAREHPRSAVFVPLK